MKNELSILIPCYNDVCVELVQQLHEQAEAISGLSYEVLVADDASPRQECIEANRAINAIAHCRFIEKKTNTGSAATRNLLARESRYEWLLFLDCDMQIPSDQFLKTYLLHEGTSLINGGIAIGKGPKDNLRYRYEKACEPHHTATERSKRPYQSFRSTNFIVRRSCMLDCPFDERFKKSGYEDVMLGKQLKQSGIEICHIDNPTVMVDFETNPQFMDKTDHSLLTLYHFRDELRGYSRLLTAANGIHLSFIRSLIRFYHRLAGPLERHLLCGNHPNLTVFNLYKLGYYLSLTKND